MLEMLKRIFPPTHRHPRRLPHEWRVNELDPFRPLEDWEHACGEVRECKLVLNFQQTGPTRITIN